MSLVTKNAPAFTADAVLGQQFKQISLEQYKGRWVVLFFYPLDFTFVCPTEITAFSDHLDQFEKLNATVLGVSVDSKFSHLAWINTSRVQGGLGEIRFPLLSDLKKEISQSYGVLLDAGVALRGLFIIDPEGKVAYEVVHDLNVGRSVDETIRVLEAIQTARETGETCPANWKPGQKTLKASSEDIKKWMSQKH